MARGSSAAQASSTFTLFFIAFCIAALHVAQDVLIPFALAILLSFLLTPLVNRLERWVGRIAAVIGVVSVLLGLFGLLAWIVSSQLVDLASKLPAYKNNIQEKLVFLRPPAQGGALSRASEAIEEIQEELNEPLPEEPNAPPQLDRRPAARLPAVPVQIVEPPRSPLVYVREWLGPLLAPVGTAGLVVILVLFMLVQREDLRDRFLRLIGQGRLSLTTSAMDDAAHRVSRYLLMQLVVNATYGLPVAVGLYFIGVPNAVLWGVLATVLRFVPYVGPWIAASMPIALSLAVFDGWSGPILTVSLFIVLELLSNNLMEPWLYGASTGVTPLAIILAAVFWTWLWGAVGLVLATPLTVCLAVLGRHVPQLEFLDILLRDDAVLEPREQLYHRLLAMDQEDALEIAEQFLTHSPLEAVYDALLVPVLTLAERDAYQGALDEPRQRFVQQSLQEMVEELGERAGPTVELPAEPPPASPVSPVVLCLPAKDEADEIAGLMLVQLLQKRGVWARNVGLGTLASEMIELVARHGATVVCISVLPPLTVSHARYLCKRLRARFPELKLVVGLWNAQGGLAKTRERLRSAGADHVATTLTQALGQIG